MWATRLHIFGDSPEEEKLISAANQMIAGLPIPTDVMSAEEQLMLLGVAKTNDEASLMVLGPKGDRPPPQLYSAPDPKEDPEAERAMEHLALLAVQLQSSLASGSDYCNATKIVLNQTRDFFQHGVLPSPGLDELDQYLLKKLGMISHCGVDKDMLILSGNITKELMCAMRVYLMNETEIHTFCPARIRYFDDNCQHVEFMNYTAISYENEIGVVQAFRNTLYTMLKAFPTTLEEDRETLKGNKNKGENPTHGPLFFSAIRLRLREKALITNALSFLDEYEESVKSGAVEFQIELKRKEREIEDIAEAERIKFAEEIQRLAAIREPVAYIPVDLGENSIPGLNITILEGEDLSTAVKAFSMKYGIAAKDVQVLENALRSRIDHPYPLSLLMGVVIPTGERKILSIAENKNSTFETHIFCAKSNITSLEECNRILERVKERLEPKTFYRNILLVVPVDAPDGRKIKLVIREGEQHDLVQFVGDFLELYRMSRDSALGLANEVNKRLPPAALQIPITTPMKRQIAIRFTNNDNITNVVEAFVNFYDVDPVSKLQILKMARAGMAPGSYVV